MQGLYIHVPFCVRKCNYCDFYSLAGEGRRKAAYVGAVLEEAAHFAGYVLQTMYIGGGTPSLLGARLLTRLVTGVKQQLELAGLIEATIEVNPDSATPSFLNKARELGFNRISIGVQSLINEELKAAGRIHTTDQARRAIRTAQEAGFTNISADLIAGLPGQTRESLAYSLQEIIETGISHVSLYCLAIEEGTPFANKIPDKLPTDDMQAEMFEQARVLLKKNGFNHYEISNFAKRGKECQHNLIYWRGGEYIGLGPAAASHLDGGRYRNKADLAGYIRDPSNQKEDIEILDITEKAAEEAILRLRLLEEGLNMENLETKFGSKNTGELQARLDRLSEDGMLEKKGKIYRLHHERILTANPVLAEVLG